MAECMEMGESKKTKARKPQRCCECGIPINVGDIYMSHHGWFEGEFRTYRQCIACDSLMDEINKGLHVDDCLAFTELREHVPQMDDCEAKEQFLRRRND